jgi:hypothetical protein
MKKDIDSTAEEFNEDIDWNNIQIDETNRIERLEKIVTVLAIISILTLIFVIGLIGGSILL